MIDPVASPPTPPSTHTPSPQRSLTGAAISGTLAVILYHATRAIAAKLAVTPVPSGNTLALRLAGVVRSLVLAIAAGSTIVFAIVAIGLVLLAVQQITQAIAKKASANSADN